MGEAAVKLDDLGRVRLDAAGRVSHACGGCCASMRLLFNDASGFWGSGDTRDFKLVGAVYIFADEDPVYDAGGAIINTVRIVRSTSAGGLPLWTVITDGGPAMRSQPSPLPCPPTLGRYDVGTAPGAGVWRQFAGVDLFVAAFWRASTCSPCFTCCPTYVLTLASGASYTFSCSGMGYSDGAGNTMTQVTVSEFGFTFNLWELAIGDKRWRGGVDPGLPQEGWAPGGWAACPHVTPSYWQQKAGATDAVVAISTGGC